MDLRLMSFDTFSATELERRVVVQNLNTLAAHRKGSSPNVVEQRRVR